MTTQSPDSKVYYHTTSLCPHCYTLLPAVVHKTANGVMISRSCPSHGEISGLMCSDVDWFDSLPKFDVTPIAPSSPQVARSQGCPSDCGLCPSHRQIAGTAAVEISNSCNISCPVCLADNQNTFTVSPEQVSKLADDLIARQGSVDAFTLSGGEPTIHPQIFDIIRVLERPEISRIILNSNGVRISTDDAFLDELARHPNVYVSLHHDGPSAPAIRGVSFDMQTRALDRLLKWNINAAPLILAVQDQNEAHLGELSLNLLRRSPKIRSVLISLMAHAGSSGLKYPFDPGRRLTIPAVLGHMETGTKGVLAKSHFMPLPMPNPMCAAIGYFLVQDGTVTPLLPVFGVDRMIEMTKNANFARADESLEGVLRDGIDLLYANEASVSNSKELLASLKKLLVDMFPAGKPLDAIERRQIAEDRIRTIYLMQFMDAWTFDSVRLSKCSCQHLIPDGTVIPSCGYYAYHRPGTTTRLSS